MQHSTRFLTTVLVVLAATGLFPLPSRGAPTQGPVRIALRPTAIVRQPVVTLGDIASVTGGSSDEREYLARLDLESLGAPAESAEITATRVAIRIRLAGFPPDGYVLGGANATFVRQASSSSSSSASAAAAAAAAAVDQQVQQAVVTFLAEQWNCAAEDVSFVLSRPLDENLADRLSPSGQFRVIPSASAKYLPGSSSIRVGIYDDGRLVHTFSVAANVALMRPVLVAQETIAAGNRLTETNVHIVRQAVNGPAAFRLAPPAAVGGSAKRTIRAGQWISDQQVSSGPAETTNDSVPVEDRRIRVPARTEITAVIARGGMHMSLAGIRLPRAAFVGDTVQLTNPISKKIFSGRLVSPTEVRVD